MGLGVVCYEWLVLVTLYWAVERERRLRNDESIKDQPIVNTPPNISETACEQQLVVRRALKLIYRQTKVYL